MGGMGGRRGPDKKELKRLEEIAKKALQEGDTTKRNVFISFDSEDIDEVNLLRAQAKNEDSEIEFNDWSLREPFDSKKAEYIKQGIKERIDRSSVTVIYLTDNSARSKWVDWEIRESINLNKGVIAIFKGDVPPKNTPNSIKEYKIPLIKWTQTGIAAAIESASKKR